MTDDLTEAELRAVVALSELYWEDVGSGQTRTLRDYLGLFPNHEAIVAAEYLALLRLTEQETAETSPEEEKDAVHHVGPYRLEREIGRGGQGVVWRAHDTRLDRLVALKVLHAVGPDAEAQIRRFRREASVVSRLSHPAICAVFEAGLADGVPFIAMELVEGETLTARIARVAGGPSLSTGVDVSFTGTPSQGPTDDPTGSVSESRTTEAIGAKDIVRTLQLFEKTARALHFAHEAGVIHRDLKPGNLMVRSDESPVILDFGLARSEDEGQETLTGTTDVLGTPAYMSPEQIEGAHLRLDCRSDVYSLGVTLWECLTLRRPFEAATRELLYERILREPLQDPSRHNPRITSALRTVLATALARDPERRYATALELAEDLRRVREHRPIHARPTPALVRVGYWVRRNRGAAIGLCVAIVSLIAGLATSLFFLGEAQEESEAALRALSEYEQMSAASLVRSLLEEEPRLWPRRPGMVGAFDAWLAQAKEAMSGLDAHRAARDRLRSAAGGLDPRLVERDRQQCREMYPQLAATVAAIRKSLEEARSRRDRIIEQRNAVAKRLARKPSARLEMRWERLEDMVSEQSERIEHREARFGAVAGDPRLNMRLTLGTGDRRLEWRHEVLTRLVVDLEALRPLVEEVTARRECAEGLARRTIDVEAEAWERCLADLRVHPSYGGNQVLAELGYRRRFTGARPQLGLIPLGRDDHSGFWEFWVEESGPRPPWRDTGPDTGRVDVNGRLAEDFGIVLVLLPGGRFTMGSSPALRPNRPEEHPPHEVSLAPFLMSKYEVTRGQWLRVFRKDPSQYVLGSATGKPERDLPISVRHPVTNVSNTSAQLLADRLAMILPTEAQWEYAARGGKATPWHTGPDPASFLAARGGNVADRRFALAMSQARVPGYDDGFALSAPVGWFPPNPFGLHDMVGNLMEWTSQRLVQYTVPPEGEDGARSTTLPLVICRGGAYSKDLDISRATSRAVYDVDYESAQTGIRLARRWPSRE